MLREEKVRAGSVRGAEAVCVAEWMAAASCEKGDAVCNVSLNCGEWTGVWRAGYGAGYNRDLPAGELAEWLKAAVC